MHRHEGTYAKNVRTSISMVLAGCSILPTSAQIATVHEHTHWRPCRPHASVPLPGRDNS